MNKLIIILIILLATESLAMQPPSKMDDADLKLQWKYVTCVYKGWDIWDKDRLEREMEEEALRQDRIVTLCGWCKKYLGSKPATQFDKHTRGFISHGMCQVCYDRLMIEFERHDLGGMGIMDDMLGGLPMSTKKAIEIAGRMDNA